MGWVNDKPIGNALVVGGGPAGALAAKALSDRNYKVTVCEAYPHPKGSEEKRHAYVVSLNSRGQRALRRVGVVIELLDGGVKNDRYVRHGKKVDAKPKIIKSEQPSLVIRRQKLTANLLALAEQSGATICCGEKLIDVDFDNKVATFVATETGKEVKRSYDLLVGADGVRSVTRTLLEKRGLVGPTRKEADDMEYQVAVLPHWRELLRPETVVGDATDNSTHTWTDRTSNSNSLVFPLDDGKSLVCVICPGGKLDELKSSKGYGPFLQALYPNWTDVARDDLAKQLAADDNVATTGGTCIWTSALASPKSGVVLVGDSGHGMWPSLGQGCNAALESSSVLADAVDDVTGRIDAGEDVHKMIAQHFDKLRHEDAIAIVDLTFGGIGSRRTRGLNNGKSIFFLQLALTMLLHKLSFKVFPMPALLRTMSGDDVSYSKLHWQNKVERLATYGVLVGIVALAGMKYFRS